MAAKKSHSLYRAMHHLRKGGLHHALKVPAGSAIPEDRMKAAKAGKNAHVAAMANFASPEEAAPAAAPVNAATPNV